MKYILILLTITTYSVLISMQQPPKELQTSSFILALHTVIESKNPSRMIHLLPKLIAKLDSINDQVIGQKILAYIEKFIEYALSCAQEQQTCAPVTTELKALQTSNAAVAALIEKLTEPTHTAPSARQSALPTDDDDNDSDWDKLSDTSDVDGYVRV